MAAPDQTPVTSDPPLPRGRHPYTVRARWRLLIRADVSWESLAVRHVDAVGQANGNPDVDPQHELRNSKKTGKFKKICLTDPDATMATSGRNPATSCMARSTMPAASFSMSRSRRATSTKGQAILDRLDAVVACTGTVIDTVTADAGYAYAKVFAGLENREVTAIIPTKAEPIRSKVPLRRFRYDQEHDLVKCRRGKILRPNRTKIDHGRFFASKARDCRGCDLAAQCLSPSRVTKPLVIVHDYPALLRARRRRERWSEEDDRLSRRHRWRSAGFHGAAKTWQGLARAVRRGPDNMRMQSFLTAAAITLKRLAAALLTIIRDDIARQRTRNEPVQA